MTERVNAVLLDSATLGEGTALDPFVFLPIDLTVYEQTTTEQVSERIANADIVLTNKVVLNADTLRLASQLKYVGVLATGMNNVDLAAASEQGITVRNVAGYSTVSVAQHTMAMILSLAQSLPAYHSDVMNGVWQKSEMFCRLDHPVMELTGKKLLIVGYGALGQATARLAEAFGMDVYKARVPGSESASDDRIELDEGLALADVVSLHCPLTEDTRHLIDARRLSLMKSHALLINTARGGIVDEQALAEALQTGILGGAGFDVLTTEPPVSGNPLLQISSPNFILTPHCAWGSPESRNRVVELAADYLKAFLDQ
ncbi:hypothetical protein GZ77_23805 [Endozoicomonas montiporae]|uniref:Glycerate dehydrogenase n=2 Tax=Endozoicomonas montiporae TaxID=1027273 RepID=A0A081MZD1_9GAMM|nr:D-2-hydroxyacid dehydrogenase [Endozoicomonas montiporae]AMO54761.1 glycerate dehydrogenase [Endozoicomonas montiporae CL-33]KEQ11554.1 hypothetical protein GZ77_23805 [Endozoicomonas montiporae]